MPAEIDTEERILYFSLEMLVLCRARNLKKLSLWFFLVLPFFFFSFALLWGGEFRGQPVISGATDLWKAKDVRYASFGECRRGFKMDACSTGDS